ncbi:hypothetical protein [Rhodopseudomonas palustris]|uniref:hypothetical protein n=1 Tax=Rhodopseudomonas palustris TaxID=1076 RepID=UPI00005D9FF4|nr:hypothetical protein [Rhodopseudomonas palustris]
MSGSAEEGVQIERSKEHLEGLQQFHSALEKLHTAEAELARLRVDLLSRGVDLDVCDELHW